MKKTFLFVLCCCAINLIYAQNIVKEHYTVSGGLLGAANFSQFRITNDNPNNIDYETKTGWSAGGWVNFPVSNSFSIEPQVMHSSYRYLTNSTANVLLKDGNITYISVPLLLKFGLSDKFAITAGPQVDFMSKVKNNPGSTAQENDFNQTSFSGFAGLEILPHGRVTIFGRYIHGFSNMNEKTEAQPLEYKNQNIQAGLKLKLFGKKVPADSDGDGVSDPNDKCPNVVGLARYDGCPIPDTDGDGINDELDKCPGQAGTAKYNGCPIPDTDGDGINDELDKCPNQAGTAKYNGCPIPDTDGDGINDELDKCPSQAGTAKYDGCPVPDRDGDGINDELDKCPDVAGIAANDGCPEGKAEVSDKLTRVVNTNAQNIVFTGTTVTLMTKSNASLNNIVKILNENPDLKAKIEGHTDNAGDDAKNMTLSANRAEAVKTYLVNKGISADRITTEGFGETMPIADNTTAAGRTKNRRVEIKVMY
jgi:outer membrane protein OmpA-like peptidoglycan-associated protein